MDAKELHENAIVFDGLNICNWCREIFEDMRRGGVTGVNCTCSTWENFPDTMKNVIQWKGWFDEHSDIIVQAYKTADIRQAKVDGKTAIVLGWQNTSAIEDQISYLRIFKELGVGVMQLTYNTQNLSGAGVWERVDPGLSDWGREVVDEMNRLGILCDLSHVGPRTVADTIAASKKPVCFSHTLPAGMKESPRNKSDEQIKAIADAGGLIGLMLFGPMMKRGNDSTIDDYVEALDYVINIAGEDQVCIGTDFSQGHGRPSAFQEYAQRDKGYARFTTQFLHAEVKHPKGFRTIGEFPNLAAAMQRAGWPDAKIVKVLGENWLRVLKEIWGA